MELLVELLLDLLIDGGIEISKNKKISKWIRYPLMIIISLFIIGVIGLVFFVGLLIYKEEEIIGVIFFIIGIVLIISFIWKMRNEYLENYKKK